MEQLKPCPFCGGKVVAEIVDRKDLPNYWMNGLWCLRGEHKEGCCMRWNSLFTTNHFGRAIDGKPTEELVYFAEAWNRRANDV